MLQRPLELDHPNSAPGTNIFSWETQSKLEGLAAVRWEVQLIPQVCRPLPQHSTSATGRPPLTVQLKQSNIPTLPSPDAHLSCLYNTNHNLIGAADPRLGPCLHWRVPQEAWSFQLSSSTEHVTGPQAEQRAQSAASLSLSVSAVLHYLPSTQLAGLGRGEWKSQPIAPCLAP